MKATFWDNSATGQDGSSCKGAAPHPGAASDLKHERKVALKVLKPELAAVVAARAT